MDIPLVSTAPTGAAGIISPISANQVPAAAQATAALIAQTTVDLSPLGRFLSAVTLFQKRLLELQANPAAVAAQEEADSEEAIAAVASAAVALSESANELQTSLINGTSDDQSLATLFNQQFNAQTSSTDEEDSASLAAIGLTFSSGLDGDDVLEVDSAVLQAAFLADPAGTATLLGRTAAAFGSLTGIAAEASADPSLLLPDEPVDSGATGLPAQAGTPTERAQDLPEFADPAPPFTSDGAFLQELLAETPRPALALSQAPPPAVAEANAAFAAERAAEAGAEATSSRAPDNATPLPPQLPQGSTDSATDNRAPAAAAPDLPPTASEVAVNATATIGAMRPAAIDTETPTLPPQANQQASAAQAARTLADQGAATRLDARDANNRIADTIAAERDASERIASATASGRAAQAAELETRDLDEAAVMRAGDKALEQRRLDQQGTQERLERAREARQLAADEADPTAALRARVAAAIAQPLPAAEDAEEVALQRPQPLPVNNAQQLARDPAIAAAIAAYNLNAGPFAALNGRPEIAAQRPKIVPAVEGVTSVQAIETDAATSDSSRPFR